MEYSRKVKNYSNNLEEGVFFGYASIFNLEDSYEDIILNGAFKNISKQQNTIPLLWQHERGEVIGIVYDFREDYVGLYVEGQIDYTRYSKIYSFIRNNIINGLSIGYVVNDFTLDDKGRRVIKSLDLLEISVVLSPANKFANIIYCK